MSVNWDLHRISFFFSTLWNAYAALCSLAIYLLYYLYIFLCLWLNKLNYTIWTKVLSHLRITLTGAAWLWLDHFCPDVNTRGAVEVIDLYVWPCFVATLQQNNLQLIMDYLGGKTFHWLTYCNGGIQLHFLEVEKVCWMRGKMS